MLDLYADKILDPLISRNIFQTYYNQDEKFFWKEYNILAFYSWFYHYFLGIFLPQLMCFSMQNAYAILREVNITKGSDLWNATLALFSHEEDKVLDPLFFHYICQNYQVIQGDYSRILIER